MPKDGYLPCLLRHERSPKSVNLAAQQATGPLVFIILLLGQACITTPEFWGFCFRFLMWLRKMELRSSCLHTKHLID